MKWKYEVKAFVCSGTDVFIIQTTASINFGLLLLIFLQVKLIATKL